MWEAQFGDFWNGAQVIVDQFLVASETKWGQPTGLVLLLPHGHEGQGPEHSSARMERFLTLCAEDNMCVGYPSTPASYFHLLRKQGREPVEKPLVVMTPKSLLRHPNCVSSLEELAEGRFQRVLDDTVDPAKVRRVVLRQRQALLRPAAGARGGRLGDVALVRVEQLYPFPAARSLEAARALSRDRRDRVGAGRAAQHGRVALRARAVPGRRRPSPAAAQPRYIGRKASAAPAPGSHKLHVQEQDAIVKEALA